jgi:type II secretory pathway component PulK
MGWTMTVDELAMRILSELEEAGAENVTSTMNTVMTATGDNAEFDKTQRALESLIQTDLVRIAYRTEDSAGLQSRSKDESLSAVQNMRQYITYRSLDRLWVWDRTQPRAEILATDLGMTKARQVLDERGYQWWHQNERNVDK